MEDNSSRGFQSSPGIDECHPMPCVPTPEQRSPNASFNPSHAQYACCFQQLHSNTGAIIIAGFHILLCGSIFPWLIRSLSTDKSRVETVAELMLTSLCLIASIVLIVGLRLESRRLLTGYILAQVVVIALLFILFLALIMGIKPGILDDPDQNGYNSLEEEMLIVVEIFTSLAVVSLEVWFLTVVLKSFRFVTDKYHYTGVDREEVL
ncbi:unnamed protein product [Caenorhabditis auriculariae]|uniref:Uncharacterized protein n=1 Tax=Caenorhabditis auriculariae TaxID=2777116 RepID=A0A8S1GS05_9PELO|nr:unnamed protein product [Caenorhabditis auriculariae]